jgi:hypothetical protein
MSLSPSRRTFDAAESLAIEVLGFLAADPARLAGFLAESGYDPGAIRRHATSPDFLAGVLDHLLADESLLLVFVSQTGTDPKLIASARRTLARDSGLDV